MLKKYESMSGALLAIGASLIAVVQVLLLIRVSWQGVVFSIPLAVIQAVLIIVCLRMSRLWPRVAVTSSPSWWDRLWVLNALAWGGGVAMLVVPLFSAPLQNMTSLWGWSSVEAALGGALPEEMIKAFGLLVLMLYTPRITRPWHGFVTGALIGLGFEVVENIFYAVLGAVENPNSDADGLVMTWVLRLLSGPFLHACCTALVGWGLGKALFLKNAQRRQRYSLVAGWWFLAFGIHFFWNLSTVSEILSIIRMVAVALIMYLLVIGMFVGIQRRLRRATQ